MRKKKKKRGMDYGTMSAATAPPVNTANMSVSIPQARMMGMKKGGTTKMARGGGVKGEKGAQMSLGREHKIPTPVKRKLMKAGGLCRGMGAATSGGKFGRNG